MRKLIIASLVLTVSSAVLAAPLSQSSNTSNKTKASHNNLSTHAKSHVDVETVTPNLMTSDGERITKEEVEVLRDELPGRFAPVPEKMGFTTPEQAEYYQLKLAGMEIPVSLEEAVFGPQADPLPLTRDGGDDSGSATLIEFSPAK